MPAADLHRTILLFLIQPRSESIWRTGQMHPLIFFPPSPTPMSDASAARGAYLPVRLPPLPHPDRMVSLSYRAYKSGPAMATARYGSSTSQAVRNQPILP